VSSEAGEPVVKGVDVGSEVGELVVGALDGVKDGVLVEVIGRTDGSKPAFKYTKYI